MLTLLADMLQYLYINTTIATISIPLPCVANIGGCRYDLQLQLITLTSAVAIYT